MNAHDILTKAGLPIGEALNAYYARNKAIVVELGDGFRADVKADAALAELAQEWADERRDHQTCADALTVAHTSLDELAQQAAELKAMLRKRVQQETP